jgi:hypothetical protein
MERVSGKLALLHGEGDLWSVVDSDTNVPLRVRDRTLKGMTLVDAGDALNLLKLIGRLRNSVRKFSLRDGSQDPAKSGI